MNTKTLTAVTVLATIASVAQAEIVEDILFDSRSAFSGQPIAAADTIIMDGVPYTVTMYGQQVLDGQAGTKFQVERFGEASFLSSWNPDATATMALYANDTPYTYDYSGKSISYLGPGSLLSEKFEFSLYDPTHPTGGFIATVPLVDGNFSYVDQYGSGLTLVFEGDNGIPLLYTQLEDDEIVGSFYKDLWFTAGDTTYLSDPIEKPISFVIEGTAVIVPEAGTVTLALMGLAALGGFTGLRRFKRD